MAIFNNGVLFDPSSGGAKNYSGVKVEDHVAKQYKTISNIGKVLSFYDIDYDRDKPVYIMVDGLLDIIVKLERRVEFLEDSLEDLKSSISKVLEEV
jgi:hypothetical protein